MSRSVSLPMYAVDVAAVDRFWQGLRRHLIGTGLAGVPERLDWPDDLDAHWRTPGLLLSQTCGYPFTTSLVGQVRYLATPRYSADGCVGADYSSVVVVRDDDPARDIVAFRGRRVAFNGRDSQSGYNGLRALVAPHARAGHFFAEALETGAHRSSLAAVRSGQADLAAIDAVTFALVRKAAPAEVAGLRVLCCTAPVPGLPLVTAWDTAPDDVARLRAALAASAADPALADSRAALLLDGFEVLPEDAYAVIPAIEARAGALGYPALS